MVDSVAGSVIGSQVQGVRASIVTLKVEKEVTAAAVKAIEESVEKPAPESSGRGSIVNIKA